MTSPMILLALSTILLLSTFFITPTNSSPITTSSDGNNDDYDDDDGRLYLYCTQGFGGTSSSSSFKIKIESHQINDGYCDCPYENGIDEYETSACSGSLHWAGISSSSSTHDDDDESMKQKESQSPKLKCPQQNKIELHTSKIDDSICDCCDGYDERHISNDIRRSNSSSSSNTGTSSNVCIDNCDILLAKERQERQDLITKYTNGSSIYQQKQQEYQKKQQSLQSMIHTLETQTIPNLKEKIQEHTRMVQNQKMKFWKEYSLLVQQQTLFDSNNDVITSNVLDYVLDDDYDNDDVIVEKLRSVLLSLCHLWGEKTVLLNGNDSDIGKKCIPLQLAGLDIGLLWSSSISSSSSSSTSSSTSPTSMERIINDDSEIDNQLKVKIISILLRNHDPQTGLTKNPLHELDVEWNDIKQKKVDGVKRESTSRATTRSTTTNTKKQSKPMPIDDDEDYGGDDDMYPYEDDDYYGDGGFDEDYEEEEREEMNHHADDDDEYEIDGEKPNMDEAKHDMDTEDDFVLEYQQKRDEIMNRVDKATQATKIESSQMDVSGASSLNEDMEDTLFDSMIGEILRKPFYKRAERLMEVIREINESMEEEKGNDTDEEEDVGGVEDDDNGDDEEGTKPKPIFDPMAIVMVQNLLNQKVDLIEKSNEIAKSAKGLLQVLENKVQLQNDNSNEGLLDYLKWIVVGTIYHSDLSAADIFEVLALVVMDVKSIDDRTCFDWYSTLCQGDVGSEHLVSRCNQRMNTDPSYDSSVSCDDDNSNAPLTIPSNIPDGYYNFYAPQSRQKGDFFSGAFQKMSDIDELFMAAPTKEIYKIEDGLSFAEDELEKHHDKLANLQVELGDDTKFGPGGVLYSINEECFEINANKYTYELCMFQSAKQREGKQKKGSGTDLGKWEGMKVNEEDGSMVFKWSGGAKCWNGPKRSATAYVSCGVENKVFTADEPNICEYEFKMESFTACNDAFARNHDIH